MASVEWLEAMYAVHAPRVLASRTRKTSVLRLARWSTARACTESANRTTSSRTEVGSPTNISGTSLWPPLLCFLIVSAVLTHDQKQEQAEQQSSVRALKNSDAVAANPSRMAEIVRSSSLSQQARRRHDGRMSLEMKTTCGSCGATLQPDGSAFICSYECTYCPTCAGASPRCPHCRGELAPRPRRETRA
jgi:uncharacterized protein